MEKAAQAPLIRERIISLKVGQDVFLQRVISKLAKRNTSHQLGDDESVEHGKVLQESVL